MAKQPVSGSHEMLACEVCLREIPPDLSVSEEAADYVHHFCGVTCYEQWRAQQQDKRDQKRGS